jgi:hypothetical protein
MVRKADLPPLAWVGSASRSVKGCPLGLVAVVVAIDESYEMATDESMSITLWITGIAGVIAGTPREQRVSTESPRTPARRR